MGRALLPEDVGGFVARWDGSFVAPPLMFDAGLDECRVLSDYRSLPSEACNALADKAREQLAMSWLVTNNDLARWLVLRAQPLSAPAPRKTVTSLGAACKDEKDCVVPAGFDARCLGGICMTDPHGPCASEGSTAPCALGSACYKFSSDLDVCSADCDVFACAGQCDAAGLCTPHP